MNINQLATNWCKPNNDKTSIESFLTGAYEKELMSNEMRKLFGDEVKGIRKIYTKSYSNDVEIIFTSKARNEGAPACYVHKNGLEPFLWIKTPTSDWFYRYHTCVVPKRYVDLDNNQVFIEYKVVTIERKKSIVRKKTKILDIDGIDVRIMGRDGKEDNSGYIIRYKITSGAEWKYLMNKKFDEYKVNVKKLIKGFDGDAPILSNDSDAVCDRMKEGFSWLLSVKTLDNVCYSSNPFFDGKIRGCFKNLKHFLTECGVSSRGTLLFNERKFREYISNSTTEELRELFVETYKFRRVFNPFKDSLKVDAAVKLFKKLQPKSAWMIDRKYIHKMLDENPKRFLEIIDENDPSIIDVKAYEKRITRWLIDCYAFDDDFDKNDLKIYLESKGISFWDDMGRNVYSLNTTEQYMSATGRRIFKGIDSYDELTETTIDIETTALPQFSEDSKAALNPYHSRIFEIGIKTNTGFIKILSAKNEKEEIEILHEAYKILAEQDTDLILTFNGNGYDGDGFDFPYMEKRFEIHGCTAKEGDYKDVKGKHTSFEYIRNLIKPYMAHYGVDFILPYKLYGCNDRANIKLGQSNKKYGQTAFYGKIVCDVRHAVDRARVMDKKIPNSKLKDNIIHANLASANRVYVDGSSIGRIGSDHRPYYFNEETGDYFLSQIDIKFSNENITNNYKSSDILVAEDGSVFYKDLRNLYILTADDRIDDVISQCSNVFVVKLYNDNGIFSDANIDIARRSIGKQMDEIFENLASYSTVCASTDILKSTERLGRLQVNSVLKSSFKILRGYCTDIEKVVKNVDMSKYEKVSGQVIIQKYLEGDLDEPYLLDRLYSQKSFAVSKWLPTNYRAVSVMGDAKIWKLLFSAFYYLNYITIPQYEKPQKFTGGILGMVSAGYHGEGFKGDFSSLYPATLLEYIKSIDIDICDIVKPFLLYGLDERLVYKALKNEANANGDSDKARFYDNKQLPLKILINSFYGMLGAPSVSPFCHIKSAWHVTAQGRQNMRHLVQWFIERKFKVVYFHTDGANFILPKGHEAKYYVGKGLNWLVEKGKEYRGVAAYVAEYNDLFLRGRMGVDIDEFFKSCINFSRGNFIYTKEKKGKLVVDYVGGSLYKSNQSEYIKDFYDSALMDLLTNQPRKFLKKYYNYLRKINRGEIVAGKIASKQKVPCSIEEYEDALKKGIRKNRVGYMEMMKKYNHIVKEGEFVYYINNGEEVSSSNKDRGTIEDRIGNFVVSVTITSDNEEVKAEEWERGRNEAQKLKKLIEDIHSKGSAAFREYLDNAHLDNNFVFKRSKIKENTGAYFLSQIDNYDNLKVKIKKFELKRGVGYNVEVYLTKTFLNITPVKESELRARMPYNPKPYISKFNESLRLLWIVFSPDVRKRIPSPNKHEGRSVEQPAYLDDKELEYTCGIPLKGDEDKQQELSELMRVSEDEMELWEWVGLSPNSGFDGLSINPTTIYTVVDEDGLDVIYEANNTDKVGMEMTGRDLMRHLSQYILTDLDNIPYKMA